MLLRGATSAEYRIGIPESKPLGETSSAKVQYQIVPQSSAILDRYQSVGIHANHMDMTKFADCHDPDYQNVLSELQTLVQSNEPLLGAPSAVLQPTVDQDPRHETQKTETVDAPELDSNPANAFSGQFDTHGGKLIQGNVFNSGGGTMTF